MFNSIKRFFRNKSLETKLRNELRVLTDEASSDHYKMGHEYCEGIIYTVNAIKFVLDNKDNY